MRQEEAKRNREETAREIKETECTDGELQRNRKRETEGHRENKKRKGETDAEKLLDVR